jgi:hypothetical protein
VILSDASKARWLFSFSAVRLKCRSCFTLAYDSSGGAIARNICSAFLADEEERNSNLAGGRTSVHQQFLNNLQLSLTT